MHEPGGFVGFGMNKSWWEGLPKDLQGIVEAACVMECEIMMSELNAKNGEYLERLVKEHGVQVREFSDEIYDSFGEAAAAVLEEARAHSDLADRIFTSFAATRASTGAWLKLSDVNYSLKRNTVLGI